jgi:hypothetical protein
MSNEGPAEGCVALIFPFFSNELLISACLMLFDIISARVFSPPWHRQQLMQKANYVASADFPLLWAWESSGGPQGKRLIVSGEGPIEEVYCRVVGIVGTEKSYLERHGNYNPDWASNTPMNKAKLQFTLNKPNDPTFGPDFTVAYSRLEGIQDRVAIGNDRSWFLMNKAMRVSFPLWQVKVCKQFPLLSFVNSLFDNLYIGRR